MPKGKPVHVIVDTNIFISFLISKELVGLKDTLVAGEVKLMLSDELLELLIFLIKRLEKIWDCFVFANRKK